MSTILLVDDDARAAGMVTRALAADGHSTAVTLDGAEGLRIARSGDFDLVLLNLPMPGMEGTTMLERALAERPNQAVVVLSSFADVDTKVRCFTLGAVDYVTKPFALGELRARVGARAKGQANGNGRPGAEARVASAQRPANGQANGNGASRRISLRSNGIELDLERRRADSGDGPKQLSNREFLLLRHLMANKDQVCTRESLLADVWGLSFDPGTNVVDVCVSRLRSKLGRPAIETVRNVGYALPARS